MADWDSSSPLDNSVVANFPANERSARAAAKTNFGVDHQETDGADVGKHQVVQLLDNTSDPGTVSGEAQVYSKTASGVVEVFVKDSAGSVSQVTKTGRLVGQQKPEVKTSSFTAVAGGNYLVSKAGGDVVVTLPASPAVGDEPITITHIAGTSNSLTVGRNSKNIMGLAEDMVIDANYASITLYWGDTSPGWRLGILG